MSWALPGRTRSFTLRGFELRGKKFPFEHSLSLSFLVKVTVIIRLPISGLEILKYNAIKIYLVKTPFVHRQLIHTFKNPQLVLMFWSPPHSYGTHHIHNILVIKRRHAQQIYNSLKSNLSGTTHVCPEGNTAVTPRGHQYPFIVWCRTKLKCCHHPCVTA